MNLLHGTDNLESLDRGVVATIGNFDGVHLGHQNLINELRLKANELNLPLLLILFEPQPREYLQQEAAPARLSSLREKLISLNKCAIDYVYCIRFNSKLSQTTAAEFINEYLLKLLKVRYLLVGNDFRFGKNREGDVSLLRRIGAQHSCDVAVYSDFCVQKERVSSTRVRLALHQGHLEKAAQLLGRNYSLCGRVTRGDGRGRQWGIPTANLNINRLALPLSGVFVVRACFASQKVFGVANIGRRPTVDGTKNILEVHLFDFDQSIYGEHVQVQFLSKLRDEVKFESVEALISQIHQDIAAARAFLGLTSITFYNDFVE